MISGIVKMQLTWMPSITAEVVSQQVVLAPVGKPTSEWTRIDVEAGVGEVDVSLAEGVEYSVTILSTTAEGQRSSSRPIEYVAGSGIPMPATDLALVYAPKAAEKETMPKFPHEPADDPRIIEGESKVVDSQQVKEEPLSLEQGLSALEELNKQEDD